MKEYNRIFTQSVSKILANFGLDKLYSNSYVLQGIVVQKDFPENNLSAKDSDIKAFIKKIPDNTVFVAKFKESPSYVSGIAVVYKNNNECVDGNYLDNFFDVK